MTASALASMRFALAMVVLVALAVLTVVCSGDSSSGQEGNGSGSATGPEEVARHAVQELSDGDEKAYLEQVRPDERDSFSVSFSLLRGDVQGCDFEGADTLVEEPRGEPGRHVIVVFKQPCGQHQTDSCTFNVQELGGRSYLGFQVPYCY